MAKQIFNMIIYTGDKTIGKDGFITYHKVNDVVKFTQFVSKKYPNWLWFTVYDNVTKAKIEVVKK